MLLFSHAGLLDADFNHADNTQFVFLLSFSWDFLHLPSLLSWVNVIFTLIHKLSLLDLILSLSTVSHHSTVARVWVFVCVWEMLVARLLTPPPPPSVWLSSPFLSQDSLSWSNTGAKLVAISLRTHTHTHSVASVSVLLSNSWFQVGHTHKSKHSPSFDTNSVIDRFRLPRPQPFIQLINPDTRSSCPANSDLLAYTQPYTHFFVYTHSASWIILTDTEPVF